MSRPRSLSSAQGFVLAAAGRTLLGFPGSDPDGHLARALGKLERALGESEALVLDIDDPPLLAEITDAAREGRQVRIGYHSASRDEDTERVVDPVGIHALGGHWYLDAWCHRSGGVRRFRVDRIVSVDDTGVVPDDGDPGAPSGTPLAGSVTLGAGQPESTAFVPSSEAVMARVSVPAERAWRVEHLPGATRIATARGTVELRLPVVSEAWFGRLLLGLGPGVRVLDPPEWRDLPSVAAARVLQQYVDADEHYADADKENTETT
jgi:proteasome accessory factor C